MTARDRLNAALAVVLEVGHVPRCAHDGDATSEHPDERARAAARCIGCPLLAPCRDVGTEEKHHHGVWGGVDFTPGKRSAGRPRKASA